MTPKKQRKPAPDVAMQDVSEPKPKPRPRRAKKSLPKTPKETAGKLERFKEEQHLKIETRDLGEEEERDAESKAPPSSSKKRRRRAAEIDRKFRCPYGDCDKAYGSESSLNQHQKLKHPEEMAEAAAEAQETQVNTFPVHTRNVSIRPATPLVTFASDPNFLLTNQPTDDLSSASDIVPPSAKAPRRNMRSRSNSEPVSPTDEVAFSIPVVATNLTTPRARTPRKPRRAATPHPIKAATTSSSTIRRSKSQSLPEMLPFEPLHELKLPPNHPNDSVHDPILPLGSGARGSFEWPIPASGHPSTSLSSDDQAIDSDILSVLANCGAEDVGDPSVLDFAGPPSTSSFQSSANFVESEDAEMLPVGMECFEISEHSTLSTETPGDVALNEPEAELGLHAFVTLGDDWHLSSHLEKMSVATPPESTFGRLAASERGVGRLRSASDPVHAAAPIHPAGLNHFSSMPLESVAAKSQVATVGQPLLHNGTNYPQWFGHSGTTKMQENSGQQMLWAPGVAIVGDPQPTSQTLDELLQHDDAVEWKAASEFEGDVGSVNCALGDAGMASTLL